MEKPLGVGKVRVLKLQIFIALIIDIILNLMFLNPVTELLPTPRSVFNAFFTFFFIQMLTNLVGLLSYIGPKQKGSSTSYQQFLVRKIIAFYFEFL
jgi:hypothetical protein